jgi:hypothetical protein
MGGGGFPKHNYDRQPLAMHSVINVVSYQLHYAIPLHQPEAKANNNKNGGEGRIQGKERMRG